MGIRAPTIASPGGPERFGAGLAGSDGLERPADLAGCSDALGPGATAPGSGALTQPGALEDSDSGRSGPTSDGSKALGRSAAAEDSA